MMEFGVQAGLNLFVHLVVLIITWWAIQAVKWDVFLRTPSQLRAKVVMILVTLTISYPVASFLINYLNWSVQLPQIYK